MKLFHSQIVAALLGAGAFFVADSSSVAQPQQIINALVWDNTTKETNMFAGAETAHFVFSFTNVSSEQVVVSSVHPSCGCTTAELPPLPWKLAPGTNGQIGATVNLEGKNGTLFKTLTVTTDKGSQLLMVKIIIGSSGAIPATDMERGRNLSVARADRQAIFKGSCASCHAQPAQGKYGKALYDAACGICHEDVHRASMVPDLHFIPQSTDIEFWRSWIAHGRVDSLMPAFSSSEGGPLTDEQIDSLAKYLVTAIPSK